MTSRRPEMRNKSCAPFSPRIWLVHPWTSPPKGDIGQHEVANPDMSTSGKISQIRAISFDGDMTLWDFDKVMRHSLAHALIELRARLPGDKCVDLPVDRLIEIRNTVAEELKGKGVALEWIRLEAFRRTIAAIGSD